MKNALKTLLLKSTWVFTALLLCFAALGQTTDKEKKLVKDSEDALKEFKKTDGSMQALFQSAAGYVVFPNVGKGAVGIGGAAGGGIVYEKGAIVGKAQLSQLTIGFQAGGQAYRELLFFENKDALDRFKNDKVEFSAQASAVAVTAGASANAKYTNGIMIFTEQKGGLMYEASVGGQKFDYTSFSK
ncbi:MAG: YSC84-related protein [Chitinophagales bacterium]